jgi:MFS transporter, DHA1 family, inner membrane transport protein
MPLGPEFEESLRLTTPQFAWIVSAYGFAASVSGLLAARFIERFDRKNALLALYAGFTIGTLLCAAAPGFVSLVLARGVAGAFAGVVGATSMTIVGDVFADARRGTAMGVVMSAFSVASILGIPGGLGLANLFGWRAPFAVLGVLSAVILGLAWWVLPPLRGHLSRGAPALVDVRKILTEPTHLRAYVLMSTLVVSSFVIHPYLSIYLVNNVGLDKTQLFYVWLCGGAVTLLTTNLFGRLSDRYGKLFIFRTVAIFGLVPTLVLTCLPPVPLAVVLLVTTVFMVALSARMVPAMAMVTACAEPRHRGSFLTVNSSVQQIAIGVAPLLSGMILGQEQSGDKLVGFPLVGCLGAAMMVGTVILAGYVRPAPGGTEAVDTLEDVPRDALSNVA